MTLRAAFDFDDGTAPGWTLHPDVAFVAGYRGLGIQGTSNLADADYPFDAFYPDVTVGAQVRIPAALGKQGRLLALNADDGDRDVFVDYDDVTAELVLWDSGNGETDRVALALNPAAFAFLELQAHAHPSAGWYAVRVDGTERLRFTGDTADGAGWYQLSTDGDMRAVYDDVYVADDLAWRGPDAPAPVGHTIAHPRRPTPPRRPPARTITGSPGATILSPSPNRRIGGQP